MTPTPEEIDDIIEQLLDAQQDINLAANSTMDQSLCDASALIDKVEALLYRVRAALSQSSAEAWHPIETAPKDGTTFLVVNAGEIERWHMTQEGVVITVKANDRPTTCAFYTGDDGQSFIDEFGEVYRPDGIVCDAEDLTEVDDVLRLTHWRLLPSPKPCISGEKL